MNFLDIIPTGELEREAGFDIAALFPKMERTLKLKNMKSSEEKNEAYSSQNDNI